MKAKPMEVGITIPLQKFLRWKQPPYGDEPRLFCCWDIHRTEVRGRKFLVVVNAADRFAGVRRMNGADWKKLDTIVPQVISQAMETIGVPEWIQQQYFDEAGPLAFTKTHGRKPVGGLNRVVDDIWYAALDSMNPEVFFQKDITAFVNSTITHCASRTDYVIPSEAFGYDLEASIRITGFEHYPEDEERRAHQS